MESATDLHLLLEVDAIKRLKARYCRLVDTKRWEDWGRLFVEDAVLDHPSMRPDALCGREQIVATVSANLASVTSVHHVHSPEIEILDEQRATGVWAMEDLLLRPAEHGTGGVARYQGYGHYIERYVRGDDGLWRFERVLLSRLHVSSEEHRRLVADHLGRI